MIQCHRWSCINCHFTVRSFPAFLFVLDSVSRRLWDFLRSWNWYSHSNLMEKQIKIVSREVWTCFEVNVNAPHQANQKRHTWENGTFSKVMPSVYLFKCVEQTIYWQITKKKSKSKTKRCPISENILMVWKHDKQIQTNYDFFAFGTNVIIITLAVQSCVKIVGHAEMKMRQFELVPKIFANKTFSKRERKGSTKCIASIIKLDGRTLHNVQRKIDREIEIWIVDSEEFDKIQQALEVNRGCECDERISSSMKFEWIEFSLNNNNSNGGSDLHSTKLHFRLEKLSLLT